MGGFRWRRAGRSPAAEASEATGVGATDEPAVPEDPTATEMAATGAQGDSAVGPSPDEVPGDTAPADAPLPAPVPGGPEVSSAVADDAPAPHGAASRAAHEPGRTRPPGRRSPTPRSRRRRGTGPRPAVIIGGALLLIGLGACVGYLAGTSSQVLTFDEAMALAAARNGYQPTATPTAPATPEATSTPVITLSPSPVATGSLLPTPTIVTPGTATPSPTLPATTGAPGTPALSPTPTVTGTPSPPKTSAPTPTPTKSAKSTSAAPRSTQASTQASARVSTQAARTPTRVPPPAPATTSASPRATTTPTRSSTASARATPDAASAATTSPARSASASATDSTPATGSSSASTGTSRSTTSQATPETTAVPTPAPPAPSTAPPAPVAPEVGYVESTDLEWGRCEATFRARLTVATSGTVSSARVTWTDPATGATGTRDLRDLGHGRYRVTLTGLPTNAALVAVVTLAGPAGTATSDTLGLTHYC